MHVRRYSYFEGSMHLHLLPILGMRGRGPLKTRASPFLGKGRHLRTAGRKIPVRFQENGQGSSPVGRNSLQVHLLSVRGPWSLSARKTNTGF